MAIGRVIERFEAARNVGMVQKTIKDDSRVKTLAMSEAEARQLRTFLRSTWPSSSLRERVEDLCR